MNKYSFLHKILPIVAIFMFVLFTLTTSCFAQDIESSNGNIYNVTVSFEGSETDFLIELDESNNSVMVHYFDLTNNRIFKEDGRNYFNVYDSSGNVVYHRYDWFYLDNLSTVHLTTTTGACPLDNVVFSSVDIYDTSGNVVFQAPVEEMGTILAPVMTETQEGTTLQEIIQTKTLQEVVEIFPIVIPVMVGLIACLVGLRYLWRLLRKA